MAARQRHQHHRRRSRIARRRSISQQHRLNIGPAKALVAAAS